MDSLLLGVCYGKATWTYLWLVCRLAELSYLYFGPCCVGSGGGGSDSVDVRFISPGLLAKTMAGVCRLSHLHVALLLSCSVS